MRIEEIEGRTVKIGATSITVKGDNGKTAGIVTGICKFKDLQANVQTKFFPVLRKTGIWGSQINGIMDCVVYDGATLYYLNNTRPIHGYEKLFTNGDWPTERKNYEKRLAIAEAAAQHMTVLNCEVIA